MNKAPTDAEKIRLIPWSIGFFSASTVWFQLTFFGSAFVLFLNELGVSKTQTGTILSLHPFSGLLSLLVAPAVARWGYKRTFLSTYAGRMALSALLLLTPFVVSHFGSQATLFFITGVVLVFAVCRAVSLTALLPWMQEFVPNAIRGKYSATSNIFTSLVGFVAVTVGSLVLGPSPDLGRFMILFGIGVAFGTSALWAIMHIPGGAPTRDTQGERTSYHQMLEAFRDGNFVRYLVGVGLITLVGGPLGSFLPLFMQEQAGLSPGNVVLLPTGALLGGLLTSYLWGWAADRYGSKPIMLSGLFLTLVLPVCWMLMPRHSAGTLYAALGIAVFQGCVGMGWGIGSGRLLYVSVVPPQKKTEYMALHFAWMGIVGGFGQLLGGRLLDLTAGISGQFLIFTLDPYTVMFVAGIVLPLVGWKLLQGMRADSTVTPGEFAGMFLRGNPFMAMTSLISYHRAKDERAAVSTTERLGRTRSPLTVDELLEALEDPRFNVRFAAIISIARRGPDARLEDALSQLIGGNDPSLSVVAAWALGRIGDDAALASLRKGLCSRYRSVQAHCARSLGTLGDDQASPLLLERLSTETDSGLRLAYADALGKLRAESATDRLLTLLRSSQDDVSRNEYALALARIVGGEHHFIRLLRAVSSEPGGTASQAIILAKNAIEIVGYTESADLASALDDWAKAWRRGELTRGVALMSHVIRMLTQESGCAPYAKILHACADRLDEFGTDRIEYVLLALHTMHEGIAKRQHRT